MGQPYHALYQQVLYPSLPLRQTHPDLLATLATLFGMNPAPVERCRVLELGCADGSNIIPMALRLPGSEFVGIDIAAPAVRQGNSIAAELGLGNIRLLQADIAEISAEYGTFDFIIAHGVFSWVPEPIQEKLFSVCCENLAPQGVAYISYNTYPGWHTRQMAREMMLYHVRHFEDPQVQAQQGRALMKFLLQAQRKPGMYREILSEELGKIERKTGSLLWDELSVINTPVYFHQFMERAGRHGLQYLAETEFFRMHGYLYEPEIRQRLDTADDIIVREQLLDFLDGRPFRQTLLCHQDIRLARLLKAAQMRRFFSATELEKPCTVDEIRSDEEIKLNSTWGANVMLNGRVSKAALRVMSDAWPMALSFDELLDGACRLADRTPQQSAAELEELVLAAFMVGMTECSISRPRFTTEVSDRPAASPLARLQARTSGAITTLRHTPLRLAEEVAARLLSLLDGTRDRQALLQELAAAAPEAPPTLESLDTMLKAFARVPLLVA